MKALLKTKVVRVWPAALTPLRVLVLPALVLALLLPASVHAGITGAADRQAFAGGIGLAAHPAGLAAAIARDFGPAVSAASVTQPQVLTATDGAANDGFGIRVALSGDGNTALVGAFGKTVGSNAKQGAVYVYTRSGATWSQQQLLTAADGAAQDGFGSPVALNSDGTVAVVGAFDKTRAGHPHAGEVYVFTRSGSTWSQQEISPNFALTNQVFGAGVAVTGDGTSVLVGAASTSGGKATGLAAFLFTRSGDTWSQSQLFFEGSAANGSVGISVALSGNRNTALIGAPDETVGTHAGAGAAYVWTRAGSAWSLQEITAADAATGDSLGTAVALSGDGNTALVGAYGKTIGNNADAGAVYVFTRSGSTWSQQEITASNGAAFDHLGGAVALSGDGTMALVGAFGKMVQGNASAGAAYVYTNTGGTWTEQKETSPDSAANDSFGISVALSGDGTTALVGAYGKTVGGNIGAGEAYLYTQPGAAGAPTGTPTAATAATGTPTAAAGGPPAGTATPTTTPTGTATPTGSTGPALSGPTTAYFAEGYTGTAAVNGRATFTETLNILNPGTTAAPVTITYYVQGANAPVTVTRTVAATSVLRESVNTDVGADKVVAAQVTSAQRVYVTRTITRTDPTGTRLDGSATLPVSAPATSWGFPEGYTGVTFQEYLTLLNPSTSPAHVTILLAPQADSAQGAKTLTLTVPAQSRLTANIRSLNQTGSAKSVGMLISSDQPIVPERVLYFGDGSGSGKFGSTVSSGIATPATHLLLAYGSSGGLTGSTPQATGNQAFITLLNPTIGGATVQVTATFFGADGQQLGAPRAVSVAAGTRQTIVVDPVLGAAAVTPFSAVLSATGPIEAEAAQYYGGSPNVGTHPGVAFPLQAAGSGTVVMSNLETSLPDGTAVQRRVYLYNPGTAAVQVAATYYGGNGATAQATYSVPAQGVTTVDVTQDAGLTLPAGALGAQFTVSGGGGSIIAYGVGTTADGLSATEDVGVPAG